MTAQPDDKPAYFYFVQCVACQKKFGTVTEFADHHRVAHSTRKTAEYIEWWLSNEIVEDDIHD